jgi:hypothetical protein
MWLSHHWPEDYARCTRIGWRHVCRRCLVVYPTMFAVCVAALAGMRWPWSWDPWILWLLPLPAALEWALEHFGRIGYSPRRNVAVSLVAAIGLGVAFARYLEDPGDALFWSVVLAYGTACIATAVLGRHLSRGDRDHTADLSGRAGEPLSSAEAPSGTAAGKAR